jgi:hypothetical protein
MLSFIVGMNLAQELVILGIFTLLLWLAGKYNALPARLNWKKLRYVLLAAAVASFIPTGISIAITIGYVSWQVMMAVTYDVCPVCFDRMVAFFKKRT